MDRTSATRTDQPTPRAGGVTCIGLRGRRLSRPTEAKRRRGGEIDAACVLPAFIAGPENQLLSRVIGPLVETAAAGPFAPEAKPSGPITLVGASGYGKTHLAHGLAELWHQSFGNLGFGNAGFGNPGFSGAPAVRHEPGSQQHRSTVVYLTASDFSRQLADAIEDGAVAEFRRDLRGCGLLVLDDLDRLSGSAHVQEELLHTIDALTDERALMIFATAKLPADVSTLCRPLVSRLSEGIVLEIAPLGVEARSELLRQVATAVGCRLDDVALATLAARLPGEPPKLLSAGVELRQRFGSRIDAGAAARFLDDRGTEGSTPLRDILAATARYYGVTQKMLTSASRRQTVVLARAVAIYLARRLTPLSYQNIGRSLGGRDHTTVLHNFRRIEQALPKDRALRSALEDLEKSLAR